MNLASHAAVYVKNVRLWRTMGALWISYSSIIYVNALSDQAAGARYRMSRKINVPRAKSRFVQRKCAYSQRYRKVRHIYGQEIEEEYRSQPSKGKIGGKRMEEGLNIVDIETVISYFDIRARLETAKEELGLLFPSARDLTPEQRERNDRFLNSIKQYDYGSEEKKIAFALCFFNISRNTEFTLENLESVLPSTQNQIKGHFTAILDDNKKTSENVQPKIEQEPSVTTQQKDG